MRSTIEDERQQQTRVLSSSQDDVHLLDLMIVLAKRRRFILLFTLGVAIVTAVTTFLLPSQYTAETVVLPPGQNSSSGAALLGQLGSAGALASVAGAGLGIKNPGDMYVSLFRSRTVEDSVIQRFGLMARYRNKRLSDTRKEFEKQSTVVLGAKDGLIRISVTDRDPKLAAEMANGYVEQFRKASANLAISEASQRRAFFDQQLLEAKGNLASAEEALKQTQQSTGVLQLDSQARALIESASVLRAQIGAKEVQLQAMRSYATEQNPDTVIAEQQLAALKAQLAKLAGNDQDSSSEFIVPKGKAPEAQLEYLRKLRDVKYYETISELIARQLEVAKLDEARQGAIIQVADVAVPPDKKSAPHRALLVVMMTLIAFALSILWIFASLHWQKMKSDSLHGDRLSTLESLLLGKKRGIV
jgi:uncharacterized protein involved in exopolysaccharide biosynthesis